MNIQVLPLKVLVTRQVINKRMDYSNYLNGTAKEELDRLDKLAGDFKFGSSKLRIDQGKGIQSDDWQDLKKKMPRGAVSYLESIEGKAEFSIVEQTKNGMRTWYIFDANGSEGDLMSEKGSWEERSHVLVHSEDFIEDGRLTNFAAVSRTYNGGRRVFLYSITHSIIIDQQGNLIRRFICSMPHLGITVTKDIWAVRIKEAQHNSGLEDSKEVEEGDIHINATLASLRKAVRNGLLNDAFKGEDETETRQTKL